MKIRSINIDETDCVIINHCIGSMPSCQIDEHCQEIASAMGEIFGDGKVFVIPTRSGEEWDFTIIKKPIWISM